MSSLTADTLSPAVTGVDDAAAAAARLGPADAHVAAILDLAAARPLALDAFLRVAAVEWNTSVSTACVECADRPRMLLNPLFVERMCDTRERLALLVLHELSHISLGHTRLYSRATAAHNIAFDVVINATILTGLERAAIDAAPYAALLESLYEPHESPWFLLRPPPGWPKRPNWEASRSCATPLRDIHRRLYSDIPEATAADDVTYGEILALLGGFTDQWGRYVDEVEKLGRQLDTVRRTYDGISGPRRRQLERQIEKVEDLREGRGIHPEVVGDARPRLLLPVPRGDDSVAGRHLDDDSPAASAG